LPPNPAPDIAFHAFADGGVLHRSGSHRLWVLNVTAAGLWCLLDGERSKAALTRDYGTHFGIEAGAARRDVDTLLDLFARWGLLNGKIPSAPGDNREAHPPELCRVENRLDTDISGLPQTMVALAGRFCRVTFPNDLLAKRWRDIAGHLICKASGAAAGPHWVLIGKDRRDAPPFLCYADGNCTADNLALDEVIPFLVYALFDHSLAGLDRYLLFHAAVLARRGQALLLAAPSGAGKSTLAAALSASGWTYLSDELAVVDPATLCVAPFALPLGLKDQSMAALADYIPGVADHPRHTRMDGVGVRYLPPPAVPHASRLPLAALVFPRYDAGAATAMTALKPLEALQGLADTGSSARPLASQDVDAMLRLASLPSYRLAFSDLEAALEGIQRNVLRRWLF